MQNQNGNFLPPVPLFDKSQTNWRNARIADFNGDGIPDLAVVYHSERSSFLRIFEGIRTRPYFKFNRKGYFGMTLPFAAPDIEVFDVNNDGKMDLYIVQANETRKNDDGSPILDNYCGGKLDPKRWWKNHPAKTPPDSFVPPKDVAPDILLLGSSINNPKRNLRFQRITMKHREPGCGYFVKKFGEKSLVLAQGGFVRPGHQLLLQW